MELEEFTHGTSSAIGHEPTPGARQDGAATATTGRYQAEIDLSYTNRLKHWWSHNVSLVLEHPPHGPDPRDYLALERTFLGWFRTSVAIGSFGVAVAQLFILKDLDPTKGKILGAVISFGAIVTSLLGCIRYFREQRLLAHGKTLAGGSHVTIFLALLLGTFFTLFLVVIIES